jgi:hypothetical protein
MLDLALFVHDKNHTRRRYKDRNKALDKALASFSETSPDLWRGVYPEEENQLVVGKVFSPMGYLSMTENRKIAEKFAHRTKKIMHSKGITAFPYWKFNIEHIQLPLKKKDEKAFELNDGQYMIDSLKEEAEWIVGHDAKFKVVSESRDGDLTIYEVEQL